jgi:hypothetical protein
MSSLAAVGAATIAVAGGILTVIAPVALVVSLLLIAAVVVTWARPTFAVAACIVVASLHRGVFLSLQVEPGGYPLSAFDVLPLLLLLASFSIAVKVRDPAPAVRGPLTVCAAMIVAGLGIGVVLGASEGAAPYELLRVVRLDALALCVVISALLAGHTRQWRRATLIGLTGAGVCVATQLLITFSWALATGTGFWSLFPFGAPVSNLLGEVQGGNILALRENAISGFLILPALSLLLYRFQGRDIVMLMLLVAGGLVWLSRGLWAAMLLTLVVLLAHRAASGRLSGVRFATIASSVAAAVLVLVLISGGILGQRFGEATNLAGDPSLQVRASETGATLEALTGGVGQFTLGLGSGVVTAGAKWRGESSALLENSVLGVWANTGLLGLVGVTILFFGAAFRGWRLALWEAEPDRAALGAMGLALPALWLQGLIGGTFSVPEPAVTLFLLAATVLVTPNTRRHAST